MEILRGEQGARILDAHGRHHGLRARIVRAFQQIGYDENTLAIYDEALGHGELVLHVPALPADRDRIAALLHRHQVHDVGYFGPARSSGSRPECALTWVRAGAQPPPGLDPDRRDLAAPGPGDPGGESSGSVTAGHLVRGDNREWVSTPGGAWRGLMYGMLTRIVVKPGKRSELLEYLRWDAEVAKASEPGTWRFDVWEAEPGVVYLYEAYKDRASFEDHAKGDPYKKWGEIADKTMEQVIDVIPLTESLASNADE